jgi:hypothetical protein
MEGPYPELDRKETVVLTKTGRVKSMKVENSQFSSSPLVKLAMVTESIPMSEKPVKAGDKWESEFDNPMVEGKKVKATYTLTGKEKVGDVETVAIKSTASIPPKADAEAKENIEIETVYFIDPKAGQIVRVKSSMKNVVIEEQGMTIKFSGDSESVRMTEKEAKEAAEKKDK